jgi:hypothetical protein
MHKVTFNAPPIENDKKRHYKFAIIKNQEKGGSWLAQYTVTNREGFMVETGAEAFSSSAPAKRWSATLVGRSRLTWDVSDDKKVLGAVHDVKL